MHRHEYSTRYYDAAAAPVTWCHISPLTAWCHISCIWPHDRDARGYITIQQLLQAVDPLMRVALAARLILQEPGASAAAARANSMGGTGGQRRAYSSSDGGGGRNDGASSSRDIIIGVFARAFAEQDVSCVNKLYGEPYAPQSPCYDPFPMPRLSPHALPRSHRPLRSRMCPVLTSYTVSLMLLSPHAMTHFPCHAQSPCSTPLAWTFAEQDVSSVDKLYGEPYAPQSPCYDPFPLPRPVSMLCPVGMDICGAGCVQCRQAIR